MTIREAIYATIVATGKAPSSRAAAALAGIEPEMAEAEYRALALDHVIVLEPATTAIRFAPPFSAAATSFRVSVGARSYFGSCAWDAFGIPAALHADARIETRCAWSDEPMVCGVSQEREYGSGIVHLLVPAAHFWDDIAFT